MKVRIAINGFGRIGRLFFRSAIDQEKLEIVAINDLTNIETLAHLLKYDSTHGRFEGEINIEGQTLIVNGKPIRVLMCPEPVQLPWADMGVSVAVESTGRFKKKDELMAHMKAGAEKVIITAPATDPDWTVVMGVNHLDYNPMIHHVISNASCTTNCLAPIAKVLLDHFGIIRGTMTTVHAYTNDQKILDLPHKDLRRARSAALSMIPTTTGAAKAVSLVLPELKGKLSGMAVRVPTPNVSLVDLVVVLNQDVSVSDVNNALKMASETNLKGILGYTDEPVVSIDFNGDERSGIIDAASTIADGNMVKILAWYDNEWAYSCRVRDLIRYMYQ